jgi:putative SOS response-associated peptidase YedK
MCNDYRLEMEMAAVLKGFAELHIDIHLSEGAPNIEPRDDIKITDRAPIIRRSRVNGMRATSYSDGGVGQTPRTKRRSARTSGFSPSEVSHGFASQASGEPTRMSGRPSPC